MDLLVSPDSKDQQVLPAQLVYRVQQVFKALLVPVLRGYRALPARLVDLKAIRVFRGQQGP